MKRMRLIILMFMIIACVTLLFNLRDGKASTLFLDDWGISKADVDSAFPDKNASKDIVKYTPDGLKLPTFYGWGTNEDVAWNTSASQQLGPGYGGQPFDLEAAYYGYDSNYFYLGFVGGVAPTGSKDPWRNAVYPIGDIFIDLNGNANLLTGWDYVLDLNQTNAATGPASMVFDLTGVTLVETQWYQTQANPFTINSNDIRTGSPDQNAFLVTSYISYQPYTNLGQYTATHNYINYQLWQHYAFEAKIPFSAFPGGSNPFVGCSNPQTHLTMKCGNDVIFLGGYGAGPPSVPEPSTMFLVVIGVIGIVAADIRRRVVHPSNQ